MKPGTLCTIRYLAAEDKNFLYLGTEKVKVADRSWARNGFVLFGFKHVFLGPDGKLDAFLSQKSKVESFLAERKETIKRVRELRKKLKK